MDLIIRNAKLVTGEKVDIGINNGRIAAVADRIKESARQEMDAGELLVSPGFVDAHLHVDKALLLEKVPDRPRPKALKDLWLHCIELNNELKQNFTVGEVASRAERLLKMAAANGTTTIRAQVDVDTVVGLTGLKGVLEAKTKCKDIIDVQVVAFPQNGISNSPGTEDLLREAVKLGANVVGGLPEIDSDPEKHVDTIFKLAKESKLPVDMHIDQSYVPQPFVLPYLAEKTRKEDYQGFVVAAHCYGLAAVPSDLAQRTIEQVKEANVSILVSPLRMMIPRAREPLDASVNMAIITDNVQDMWYPFGSADQLYNALLFAQLTYGFSIQSEEWQRIWNMITVNPSSAIGLEHAIRPGKPADLVIVDAPSPMWALIRQSERVYVLKRGRIIAEKGKLLN